MCGGVWRPGTGSALIPVTDEGPIWETTRGSPSRISSHPLSLLRTKTRSASVLHHLSGCEFILDP